MAVVLSADGSTRVLLPAAGTSFKLADLQALVGGYIQAVPIGEDKYLVCNEDGKRMRLPPNAAATMLLHAAGGMPDDTVVGEVLIASHAELGGGDEDGDD